ERDLSDLPFRQGYDGTESMKIPFWNHFLVFFGRLLANPRLWRFLLHPVTRYTLAWIITLGGAGLGLYEAWTAYDKKSRGDGNEGHTTIDFGGQYLMGRMLLSGHGRHLYHRDYHRLVLTQSYPKEAGDPSSEKTDVQGLMAAMMGPDTPVPNRAAPSLAPLAGTDALSAAVLTAGNVPEVGGPLYPPINAFMYAPLALLDPLPAYHANQVMNLLLAFTAG